MVTDFLSLGGVVFDNFSAPQLMPFGGDQSLVVHKLPGGARVIDALGPDDADISWHGRFFGDTAYGTALMLDSLRRSGVPLPLVFGGQSFTVVISHFRAEIERFPLSVLYHVSCVIVTNVTGAAISAVAGGAALAAQDLASAAAL